MISPPIIPSPTGTTRLIAMLGDPVAQVQAPMLMNQLFAAEGTDALMIAVQASADHVAAVIEGLQRIDNLSGLLLTVPHKFAVLAHADTRSVTVELAGSANALRRDGRGRWHAENFDGLGFVEGLRAQGRDPRGLKVALVGAGGAGVALAAALVQAGVARLGVTDSVLGKARDLVARLDAYRPGIAFVADGSAPTDVDLAINATPMGLRPEDPLPFDVARLPARAVVADIVMKPPMTRLLQAARDRGLATHAGLHMLTPQIAMYRDFFLG